MERKRVLFNAFQRLEEQLFGIINTIHYDFIEEFNMKMKSITNLTVTNAEKLQASMSNELRSTKSYIRQSLEGTNSSTLQNQTARQILQRRHLEMVKPKKEEVFIDIENNEYDDSNNVEDYDWSSDDKGNIKIERVKQEIKYETIESSNVTQGYTKKSKEIGGRLFESFQCTECEYSTIRKDHFKRHFKCVHQKIKDFQCQECPFATGEKGKLTIHIRQKHGSNEKS